MKERAILHFDGDSFFASVEVALNHTLRGKPVITGAERGAATSASYEAKRLGITRSMTMKQIKAICPDAVIVNSDYRAYAIFAHRMYRIARRFTPHVEEYSVDECFADITGLDKTYGMPYQDIALMIKKQLELSLGITFGVGLAPTKVLAKAGSKYHKPAGFTHITLENRAHYLADMPIGSVWGIGPATSMALNKLGVTTALQFANKRYEWLSQNGVAKPHRGIWYELNGTLVHDLSLEHSNSTAGSIISSRTFSPPSTDKTFLYSQLAKNIERACQKARDNGWRARAVTFYVKTQEFFYGRVELTLQVATADPRDILAIIKPHFETLYRRHTLYRATGISLRNLIPEDSFTADLFGAGAKTIASLPVLQSIDKLNRRYGGQTIYVGASMQAINYREKSRVKKEAKRQSSVLLPSAYRRKSLDIPFLGVAK